MSSITFSRYFDQFSKYLEVIDKKSKKVGLFTVGNFDSFAFLAAVACRGWKNGKMSKCEVGLEGQVSLFLQKTSIYAFLRVSDND